MDIKALIFIVSYISHNIKTNVEQWLKTISEKLSEEDNQDFEKNKMSQTIDQSINTADFVRQVTAALKDEFVAETTLMESNYIQVKFSENNVFIIKILKI